MKNQELQKYKTFFNLPIVSGLSLVANIRNYLAALLFTGLWYFILAMGVGVFCANSASYYIQSSEKQYVEQAFLLLSAFILNFPSRGLLNIFGDKFFINKKADVYVYSLMLVIIYFAINEILGF